jgi:hypothetical protein
MKKTSTKGASKASASGTKAGAAKKPAAEKMVFEKVAALKPAKPSKKPAAAPAAKAAKPSPRPKAKPTAVVTTIVAAIDVGFGNHLTLRGEGPGLSWDVGVPLECVADDRWSITLPETSHPIICKFLLNDTTWCVGEDYTVLPGSTVVLSPRF